MKILESKFFKRRSYLTYNEDSDLIEFKRREDGYWNNSNTPYNSLLGTIMAWTRYFQDTLVIREKFLQDFEKCTDFVGFRYSKTKNTMVEQEVCYFHPEFEIFLVLESDLADDYDKEEFVAGIWRVEGIYYQNNNPKHGENFAKFFEKYLEKYISPDSKVSLLVREWDRMSLNEYKIHPHHIDFDTMYNDDFKSVHAHITHELKHSKKWIVLLHGLPGSGKTNYIKWLTGNISEKKFIFVPTTMIASITEPTFINFLIENKNSILIFEDCENYIAERSSHNAYTDVVSSILNLADGILSDVVECQIICTFNATIDEIDSALLRQGRLIAEYCFKELTTEKVNEYFASIGSDYRSDKPLLLSEATNISGKIFKEEKEEKRIGFDVE